MCRQPNQASINVGAIKPGDCFVLAADIEASKVGCVNIQAAMGGSSDLVQTLFNTACWETGLPDGLTLYSITFAQAQDFARRCNDVHKR